MCKEGNSVIHHTGKPLAAGIINIIIGSLCVLGALIIGFGMLWVSPFGSNFPISPIYLNIMAAYFIWKFGVLGILSIIGGVCNIKRRKWGLALTGSIAVAVLTLGGGVVSVILTAISREEFA